MTTSNSTQAKATRVAADDRELEVHLADGRRLHVPLSWFPRLQRGTAAQRANWRLIADGSGIHWPDLDEDLAVDGLLGGAKAPGVRTG